MDGISSAVTPSIPKLDRAPPPQPQIQQAIAYANIPREDWPTANVPAPAVRTRTVDPGYILIANYEAGTTLELINKSKTPGAILGDKQTLKMVPDIVDVANRRAAIRLDNEQMKKLGIEAGAVLIMRAVNEAGKASPPTPPFQLDPNAWANGPGKAAQLTFLRDAFTDEVGFYRGVTDTTPPVLDLSATKLTVQANGVVAFNAQGICEPGSQVTVAKAGKTISTIPVGIEGNIAVGLPGVQNGDELRIGGTDRAGNHGVEIAIQVDGSAPNGFAVRETCEPPKTKPQTPQVKVAVAYEKMLRDVAQMPTRPAGHPRDPVYIELANVDVELRDGKAMTTCEMIDTANNPNASFDNPNDVIKLSFSVVDVVGRRAAVHLSEEMLAKYEIDADEFKIRVVSPNGLVSDEAAGIIDPNAWAGGVPGRPGTLRMMNDQYSDVMVYGRGVSDQKATKVDIERIKFTQLNDQTVTLSADHAMPHNTTMVIVNLRTGPVPNQIASLAGGFSINIPAAAGDKFLFRAFDAHQVLAPDFELVYDPSKPLGH